MPALSRAIWRTGVSPLPSGARRGRVPLLLSAVCLLAAVPAFGGARASAVEPIPFQTGPVTIAAQRAEHLELALAAPSSFPGDAAYRRVVIQFADPVSAEQREVLRAQGVMLLDYIGANAYFAGVDAHRLRAAGAAQAAPIHAVTEIDPAWKLHPDWSSDPLPDHVLVGAEAGGAAVVAANVVFHRDAHPETMFDVVAAHGALVRSAAESVRTLVVELPAGQLAELAAEDAVQWIEPPLPALSSMNDCNRAHTQAGEVQEAPYGLDGSGVTVLVYDGGYPRTTHVDFEGRVIAHETCCRADHPTHVSATIGGAGVANPQYKGMAPGVTIHAYGYDPAGSGVILYDDVGDIEADYTEAINTFGCQLSNNSIGSNVERNSFPCTLQGNYGVTSQLLDGIVRGSLSEGVPFRILWAGGNERGGDVCDVEGFGDYYSIAPPSGAKNPIAVGAVECDDADTMSTFSSWGPMDDGRMKPDVVAPGVDVTSAVATSDTAYGTYSGTSMATPTVTGLCALLIQDYHVQFIGPDPRNSTLKVLLAQTAVDRGQPGPDYQYGYGSVRIRDAIDLMRTGNFLEDEVAQQEVYSIDVEIGADAPDVKVTLAWDDVPGTPNSSVDLVNDLDLVLIDPAGTPQRPWTLDPANPSAAAVRTQPNRRDNLEQVWVPAPTAGTWRVEVHGYNVPEGPQPFSLCASGALNLPPALRVSVPEGTPAEMPPGVPATFTVRVAAVNDVLVAPPELRFRYDGEAWLRAPLVPRGGEYYDAVLPAPVCGATPEFYVAVAGEIAGEVTSPPAGAAGPFAATVFEIETVFADDFELDRGWTAGAPDDTAVRGLWNRGDPEETIAQPEDDHTPPPGTRCYATDTSAGSNDGAGDVDGGRTTLLSPILDMTVVNHPVVSYWRWYSNHLGGAPPNDVFRVQISSDGGASWTNAEVLGPTGDDSVGGWRYHEFLVTDIIAPVTNRMRLRFAAADEGDGSLVEAAVDDFAVTSVECRMPLDDCNGNFIVDADDIAAGRSADTDGNGVPDECEAPVDCPGDFDCDGDIDFFDIDLLLAALGGEAAWQAKYVQKFGASPPCGYLGSADMNGDGGVDFFDIDPFLARLGGGCP